MPVHFANNDVNLRLKQKTALKNWIQTVIEKEKLKTGTINYIFCSDEALLKINQQFLNHNTYTDIITFDYREANTVNGEIYISTERIKENAQKFDVSFEEELHRVMIHGVLHICGYKDKGKEAAALMRKMEDKALNILNTFV